MAKQTQTTPQLPSHDVFHVIGDGKGFNITLNFMPLTQDGRFVVRKAKPKAEAPAGQ